MTATAPAIAPDWLGAAPTVRVMAALGGRAYFVGGCVRNALLGHDAGPDASLGSTDIDLSTPLTPPAVTEALETAGLKAVPTGIEHGTVTAVADGYPFEITTFRADVETDGRRAVVRFTEDMAEDAQRRDFTMNALYADRRGSVLDPLGGLPDLKAGRVRFIGAADRRIREDALRILRFFRFGAWYGRAGIDGRGLDACTRLAGHLEPLARERVGQEVRKLLAAPDPGPAVAAMAEAGVLARAVPGGEAAALARLLAVEAAAGVGPDWLRRLAGLGVEDPFQALRLSRAETRALEEIWRLAALAEPPEALAERAGIEPARHATLLRAARQGMAPPDDLEARLHRGAAAEFPVTARDLMQAGIPRGPDLGRALEEARADWRASGFALERPSLLAEAARKYARP